MNNDSNQCEKQQTQKSTHLYLYVVPLSSFLEKTFCKLEDKKEKLSKL